MQHNFHCICKSPLALSLGQPLSSAVAQQYAHDFGLLQHEELSPQTMYSACVYVWACGCGRGKVWASDKKLMEDSLGISQLHITFIAQCRFIT